MKKTMKKFISVILAIVMIFPIVTIITSASITLVWPVPDSRKINQGFHSGCAIDIGDSSSGNAKIVSATSGTVKNVFKCTQQHYGSSMGSNGVKCDGFGTGVVIQGPDGRFYGYAHMKANSIPSNIYVGASVSAGQHIGNIGSTGNSSGNHLHFQITTGTYYNKDSNINPSNETYTYSTLTTYTITYDANGGYGAPSPQTYTDGTDFILSSVIPYRTGYTFHTWTNTPNYGSVVLSYPPGSTQSSLFWSGDKTLYAVWDANEYTINYNSNGGSGSMSSSSHRYDIHNNLNSNAFTRSGYTFLGWSTSASATSPMYYDGQSVVNLTSTNGATVTLYAVWQQNHTHKYVLTDSYAATCTTDGYKEYTCSCDDKYTTVTQHALGHDFSDYDIESAHPHYSIYRCSRNGCSEISRTFDTNYDISCSQCNLAPGKATDVTVTAGKSNTATEIKWNAREVAANDINDADYFNVKIYRKESGSYSLYSSEKVNYSLTKLNPSVSIVLPAGSYYAEIVTICGENKSLTSCTDKYYFTVESSIATYTLTYNANGGSTPPSSQSGATTYTISSIKPTRSGYTFLGWSKSSSATSPSYYEGDSITISANTTLYAVWSINKCGDNLIWTYDEATETVTISGSGDMYDWEPPFSEPSWGSSGIVKKVKIENGVTRIGDSAFFCCGSLTSITIPDSVTSIGDGAFVDCDNLTNITIPDSVTSIGDFAFFYCDSLKSVTIPDSVTSIGDGAFSECNNLTSITIPDSVTIIGGGVFSSCNSLTSITIPDSVSSIGEMAFEDCINLKSIKITDSVTNIGDRAFFNCSSLINVTIPGNVSSVGKQVFLGCTSLTSVIFGNGVTTIGDQAFCNCTSLTNIIFPDSVKSVDKSAFSGCTSLTSITMGNGITNIGHWAFHDCTNLTDVYYNGSEEEWNNINIGSQNDDLLNATIHFVEHEVYTIEFIIDNSKAIKEIYTVEGTFKSGDTIRLSDAVITKKDGTKGVLPVIGKENKEQPGGPYKGVDGYKFAGWKVGAQAAFLVDFDITQEVVLTPEFINAVTFNNTIRIKGCWEAIPYDFVAYYAKSFDADGNPVYEAMPAVKVKTGANLGDYLAAATETVNENLPEGKRFSLWRTEDGSVVANRMPAYGYAVYATYVDLPRPDAPVFVDKDNKSIKVEKVENVEFSIDNGLTWNESGVFTGLQANTTYVILSRFVYDKNVQGPGKLYGSLEIRTNFFPSYSADIKNVKFTTPEGLHYADLPLEIAVNSDEPSNAFHNIMHGDTKYVPQYFTVGDSTEIIHFETIDNRNYTASFVPGIENAFKKVSVNVYFEKMKYISESGSNTLGWVTVSTGESKTYYVKIDGLSKVCDHNFVPSVTVPATCTENGVMTYTCECGDSFTEEIPATGHVPGNWNVSIPASCTVDGESVLCCEECGIVLGNKSIPATGHVPGFWVIVVEPTTETEGSKIKCCDICGDLLEEETIAKLPPKEPVKDNAVVKNPSTSTISYGDAIILHVDASKIPEGGYVEWTADNGNFSYKADGATCTISPAKSGDTTFTATIYDANGNAVSTDEQTMTAKAGFFDKIIAFFKGLFGLSKTYPSVFKGIF